MSTLKQSHVLRREALRAAILQLKLSFGLRVSDLQISYPDFAWGQHTANSKELILTNDEQEEAFAILEHSAIYLAVTQILTTLEIIFVKDNFYDDTYTFESDVVPQAYQIARLIRNAFAHDPFAPIWEFKPKWANKIYEVPGIIRLDTTGLNGLPVRQKHYGGPLAVLRFTEYTSRFVSED